MGIRYAQIESKHAAACATIERRAFPELSGYDLLTEEDIRFYCSVFSEGGFVALDGETPVGMGLGIFLDIDFSDTAHSLEDLAGEHQCANHDPSGEWYYGIDLSVLPEYRGRGIGSELYKLRKGVVRAHNRRGIVAGGVIPGYADHIDTMNADEYIRRVAAGELHDPTLSFQIARGFRPRAAIPDYMGDESVGNWAVLIVWHNPTYRSGRAT
ncbi:MAG TPA: GNAT family N-acetyltransferase [Acidobacteriota bacterium]|nr:GNAT family N-acetyltransferase [Acidobacteriota bacterium]